MKNVKIFCDGRYDNSDFDLEQKCYRADIYVLIDGSLYSIFVITGLRLNQEFQHILETNCIYQMDPHLLIVNTMDINDLIETIRHNMHFFSGFMPEKDNNVSELFEIATFEIE